MSQTTRRRNRIYFSGKFYDFMQFGQGMEITEIIVTTPEGSWRLRPCIDHKGIDRECDPLFYAERVS